ncbi:hypothetical protein TUM20985_06380 [Mycobacterium antarcticum]|uniref:hypothetical protein n=1 Tax=unclassified Mycolicibacterium TaxID=2636767 RepID=UPI0023A3441C|nr:MULTISPECIES: hypothetical protein [unclassified Mycolicibacterium]BDX30091.1 hypothetical protein TUM20985_06380 [Mycolicibacterium sp. TUM20985]GLP73511.1 hypothetical protein TUM20983_06210 [Mycolicibacterium sp. TUM20983]GLP79226.1 hypothetical protein TUM20984_06460 [Mycolicibacterium sp. TUM20984]
MTRLGSTLATVAATLLALACVTPTAPSGAATKTATSSIPIDGLTTLEMHTTATCVKAENQCYFDTAANLRGADGAFIPFPNDFYARQNTTLRSSNRLVYLDSDFNAPNTRMMKSIGPVEFPTVYFGGGPPEKFMVHGNTRTVDWATGQPKTDADYIVCAFIQVVYGSVNLTTPTACAQTTYA